MFDFRTSVLAVAVAVCVFSAGVLCSPTYPRYSPSGNNLEIQAKAHEVYQLSKWQVNNGYPQPINNPFATGYVNYPAQGMYKVHRNGATWHEAMQTCAAEGSSLVIVTSQSEADFIKSLFRPCEICAGAASSEHFWVGAQERGVNGQFYTVVGVRLEQSGYLVWSPLAGGQPNNPGNADCVSIFTDGTYFDDDCTTKYPFVCEKIVN